MRSALVLTCDDKFIPYTAVVARRIAHHAAEAFPIIVISDAVSDENKGLAQRFCPRVTFIEASQLLEGVAAKFTGGISRAVFLRLFLDEILSEFDRAVYLDSDISLLTDVSPLLSLAPKAAPIVATHDLNIMVGETYRERLGMSGPYFNSGIMVLDLKAIRAERIFAAALDYSLTHSDRCYMADQDALNAVLDGRWQTLDWRWNAMNYLSERMPKEPFIRHFAGSKPWGSKKLGVESRFVKEWRANLSQSPWPDQFMHEAFRYRLRRALGPLTTAAAQIGKSLGYANTSRKRSNRARLVNNFPKVLTTIEQSAAAASRAEGLAALIAAKPN